MAKQKQDKVFTIIGLILFAVIFFFLFEIENEYTLIDKYIELPPIEVNPFDSNIENIIVDEQYILILDNNKEYATSKEGYSDLQLNDKVVIRYKFYRQDIRKK